MIFILYYSIQIRSYVRFKYVFINIKAFQPTYIYNIYIYISNIIYLKLFVSNIFQKNYSVFGAGWI